MPEPWGVQFCPQTRFPADPAAWKGGLQAGLPAPPEQHLRGLRFLSAPYAALVQAGAFILCKNEIRSDGVNRSSRSGASINSGRIRQVSLRLERATRYRSCTGTPLWKSWLPTIK